TFNLAYVALVVSARLEGLDRTVELAAHDLGATPWAVFWKITFPAAAPGILSGAILAFTLSFDDFVVTYFTTGPGGATLPVRIYSMVRFGVTPEMNAVATVILAASLALIALALRISRVPPAGVGR
ncbi:MAG: ABC transporter permease, partial [Planctomycetota bacterium]